MGISIIRWLIIIIMIYIIKVNIKIIMFYIKGIINNIKD